MKLRETLLTGYQEKEIDRLNEELTELNNGIRKHIIPKMKGKIIEYLNANGYSL